VAFAFHAAMLHPSEDPRSAAAFARETATSAVDFTPSPCGSDSERLSPPARSHQLQTLDLAKNGRYIVVRLL